MDANTLSFATPLWLAGLILVPVLILVLLWTSDRLGVRRGRAFFGDGFRQEEFRATRRPLRLRQAVTSGVVLCFVCIGLARPVLEEREDQAKRLGVDVMVALDVSRSMLAKDYEPSRLEASKAALKRLTNRLTGDRVGIIVYAGEARLVAPLTFDTAALNLVIDNLDEKALWRGGSSMTEAIDLAAEKLRPLEGELRSLIIVSDGEDHEGDAILAARKAHLEDGLNVFTVGVGTASGAPIEILSRDGRGKVVRTTTLRDEFGQPVNTRLRDGPLEDVAKAAGGFYVPLGEEGTGLEAVFDQGLRPLGQRVDSRRVLERVEAFQWPLLAAFLAAIIGMLISQKSVRLRPALAAVLMSLGLTVAEASTPQEIRQMMEEGKAEEVQRLLREDLLRSPGDSYLLYNYGLAAYVAGDDKTAETAWSQLAREAEGEFAGRAQFQLGNLAFRTAYRIASSSGRADAAVYYEKAREHYRIAAAMGSGHARSATNNLEITEKELRVLYLERGERHLRDAKTQMEAGKTLGAEQKAGDAVSDFEAVKGLKEGDPAIEEKLAEAMALQAEARLALARQEREKLEKAMEAHLAEPDSAPPNARKVSQDIAKLTQAHDKVLGLYEKVLEVAPDLQDATTEQNEVRESAASLLETSADKNIADGQKALESRKANQAQAQWTLAMDQLTRAEIYTPDSSELTSKRETLAGDLKDLLVEQADANVEIAKASQDPKRHRSQLESATKGYTQAMDLDAEDASIAPKLTEAQGMLADALKAEADKARAEAQELKDQALPKAIAQMQVAIRDYDMATTLREEFTEAAEAKAAAIEEMTAMRSDLAKKQAEAEPELAENQPLDPSTPSEGQTELNIDDLRDLVFSRDLFHRSDFDTKRVPPLRDW